LQQVPSRTLYPTHVGRSPALLAEAAAITHLGAFVDLDTVEEDLRVTLDGFKRAGGDFNRLTVSSDAAITAPRQRLDQLRACVHSGDWSLEQLLPLVTTNPAAVLKLANKGHLSTGADADLLVLERDTLALRHVVGGGRVLMRDGVPTTERFVRRGSRKVTAHGEPTNEPAP
jgi:beta-aspartyl-dipeptidase (metallo-type)